MGTLVCMGPRHLIFQLCQLQKGSKRPHKPFTPILILQLKFNSWFQLSLLFFSVGLPIKKKPLMLPANQADFVLNFLGATPATKMLFCKQIKVFFYNTGVLGLCQRLPSGDLFLPWQSSPYQSLSSFVCYFLGLPSCGGCACIGNWRQTSWSSPLGAILLFALEECHQCQ